MGHTYANSVLVISLNFKLSGASWVFSGNPTPAPRPWLASSEKKGFAPFFQCTSAL